MIAKVLDVKYNKATVALLDGSLKEGDLIRIKKVAKKRTLDQNALYWLLMEFAGKQLGYEAEELHEIMKAKFLKHIVKIKGEMVFVTRSTTTLDKIEFGEYFDKVNRLLIEYGVNVAPFWQEYEKYRR